MFPVKDGSFERKYKMKKKNFDFWSDLEDETGSYIDEFFGSKDNGYFELSLSPFNEGYRIDLTFLTGSCGDELWDAFLTITGFDVNDKYANRDKRCFRIGDISEDQLTNMAIAILEVTEPELLNDKEVIKHFTKKEI